MSLSPHIKRNFRTIVYIAVIGMTLGVTYAVFSDGFKSIYPFLNGATTGLIAGGMISTLEIYGFRKWRTKLNFFMTLLLRSFSLSMIIGFVSVTVTAWMKSLQAEKSFLTVFNSPEFEYWLLHEDFPVVMIYSLAFGSILIFTLQVSRKMGQGVLLNIITGRYHKPREENRIFLFMDLNNSVSIAERLGHLKYHNFLNELFQEITENILLNKGEIYQYVGDEIVISWKWERGIRHTNCVNCFFSVKKYLDERKDYFRKKYGVVPDFKAGLHGGKVIIGEIGDVKVDIAFHGDVVNTTARLESECHKLESELLISGSLLNAMTLPQNLSASFKSKMQLRGKEGQVEVYSLSDSY